VFLLAEPYADLRKTTLQQLFEEHSRYSSEVPDQFLSRIADCMSCPEKSLELFKQLFKPNPAFSKSKSPGLQRASHTRLSVSFRSGGTGVMGATRVCERNWINTVCFLAET